jgi:O-antigen ligase
LLSNGITGFHKGYVLGNLLIPICILLFWLWLGINIAFSQVVYLSVANFWWVGIFPLVFLAYSFTPNKDSLWKPLFTLLVFTVVIICFYALYQAFVLHELPSATFYNKNSLAALINLLFFPVLAYALIRSKSSREITTSSIIFVFALVLALINSRGALLALFVGGIIMLVLGWSQIDKRRLVIVGMVIIGAFFIAGMLKNHIPHIPDAGVTERIATLRDTESAGHTRFVIWQPAWELFKQYPWTGIGLGTYFLAIPPFLHADDHSAGFYVHNDYLQIALETGIPGFIFLFLILLATLYRFINTVRSSHGQPSQHLQLLASFTALLTLAIHSAFTYNLYIMPIMLLAGLMLGRFNYIADQLTGSQLLRWNPANKFNPTIYYTTLVLVAAILSSYFLRTGYSHHYQQKGYELVKTGQLQNAHQAFNIAQKLAPRIDSIFSANADLLRKSALLLVDRPEMVRGLLEEAKVLLKRAEKLNPLRPQTPYIRGLVLEQDPVATKAVIIESYQTALKRNPRFIPARLALARYLLAHDNIDEAFQILQQGLVYNYRRLNPAYLQLLEMNYAAAISLKDKDLAKALSSMLEISRQDYAVMLSAQRHNKIINPY